MKKKQAEQDSPSRPKPSDLRRGVVSTAEMLALSQQCREYLARIEVTLRHAASKGIDQFESDGMTQLSRSSEMLSKTAAHFFRGVMNCEVKNMPKEPETA